MTYFSWLMEIFLRPLWQHLGRVRRGILRGGRAPLKPRVGTHVGAPPWPSERGLQEGRPLVNWPLVNWPRVSWLFVRRGVLMGRWGQRWLPWWLLVKRREQAKGLRHPGHGVLGCWWWQVMAWRQRWRQTGAIMRRWRQVKRGW